jgi:hypothetical protein
MLGFGRKGKGPLYGALIDIGSGTLGVAIVASDLANKLPVIVYMNRITMRVGKRNGYNNENLRRVREMLFSASLILSQEGFKALREFDEDARIDELCVTCSSPWSYTVSRHVEYKDDEPFKVNSTILKDLIDSAESEIVAYVREKTSVKDESFDIVERATTNVTVNEYPVANPLHVEGSMLTLSHIAGLIPTKIMGSVHEIQDKLFPGTQLHAHTSMLVMYSVVRDLFPRVHSFCIINVTAEATEFGIVEDDVLMENSFVLKGTNAFVQGIMERSERPLADIQSSMRSFGKDGIPEDADLLAESLLYKKSVSEGIESILERRAIPNRFIITAHEPYKSYFREMIGESLRATLTKKPDLLAMDEHLINEISHGAGEDVYLALAARFFHKLHAEEEHK